MVCDKAEMAGELGFEAVPELSELIALLPGKWIIHPMRTPSQPWPLQYRVALDIADGYACTLPDLSEAVLHVLVWAKRWKRELWREHVQATAGGRD